MHEYDVIVVGAGISGLSFANECAGAGLETLVLERSSSAGGCVHSHRLADGFWFELGAHTLYDSYGTLLGIIESRLGLDRIVELDGLPFRLFRDGELRRVTKELSVWRLLVSAPRLFVTSKRDRSVRDYYARVVGRRNYERVLGPMMSAVPSQPVDAFPAEMLFKRRSRRKDVPRRFAVSGGLGSIIEALADAPGLTLLTDAEVTFVDAEPDRVVVGLASGESHAGRFLALASPPPVGARLLREAAPALAHALARIDAVTVSTLGVVVSARDTELEPVAGIIPLAGPFFSAVSRDRIPDADHRAFSFHLRPGVSREEALEAASELLRVDRAAFFACVDREVTIPSPRVGHRALVEDIDRACAGTRLFVTGNYFGGLALEDCVVRSRREAARLLGPELRERRSSTAIERPLGR
jgi:protoporphyrinogen oxidase